jgi:hypothetical protein
MNEPIDIRTRRPLDRKKLKRGAVESPGQDVLTAREVADQRQRLAASRLDAQFGETGQRIRRDLSRIKPGEVASALSRESREDAASLIAEVRTWLDEFERALAGGGNLRAV